LWYLRNWDKNVKFYKYINMDSRGVGEIIIYFVAKQKLVPLAEPS
jgi:hypothetical protein